MNIKNPEKGEIFRFGFYYEEIEWLVIDKKENKVLAVTKNCIDSMPINQKFGKTSWADSKIRKWLNGVFFDKAFTGEEKKLIVPTEIENPKNRIYGNTDENKTIDRFFLLSIEEAEKCFASDEERIAAATDFAMQSGIKADSDGNCIWWLRTPGIDSKRFAVVSNAGYIYEIGSYADSGDRGIRPAMWIDLSPAEYFFCIFP